MGKFAPRKPSNLLSRSASTTDHPKKSEELQTTMPVAASIASLADMLAPKKSTQSRLHRLSLFLPKLKTSETKLHKDRHEPSLPRKREPSPYEHHRHAFSQPPPARAPPPPPVPYESLVERRRRSEEDEGAERSSEQWQRGPPSRMAPNPRHANGSWEPDAETHNNRIPEHSPTPSPPPQTYTPPPRTSSTSPHTLDYQRPRASSLLQLHSQSEISNPRSVSTPFNSRPDSSQYYSDGEGGMESLRQVHRKSSAFLSGLFHSPTPSQDGFPSGVRAWVLGSGGNSQPTYDLGFLMRGDKIPELWDSNELADLYIYFYPRTSGRGPQIKCPSLIIQSSSVLRDLSQEALGGRNRARSFDGRASLTIEDATRNLAVRSPASPPYTPQIPSEPQSASDGSEDSIRSFPSSTGGPRELHLYLPLRLTDAPEQSTKQKESTQEQWERETQEQKLIDARNLFAFLNGQVLIATKTTPTTFRCFLAIANLLKLYGFSEDGGVSYGKAVDLSFEFYLTSRHFADARESRERTLEALILGEAMKSSILYNEAFAHAVGKYEIMKTLRSPLWQELSPQTKQWVERGHLQMRGYKQYAEERLTDFEFPSLFAGIANSTSSEESKIFRFKYWKSNFMSLRKAVLSYYKSLHGSWPPKASSKKNSFVEGGLNRLVLKGLYSDLCDLYDFLVDRDNITTRVNGDEIELDESTPTAMSTLRKLLAEFDKSTTWTTPAIPLDVPHLPSLAAVDPNFQREDFKEQAKMMNKRKLKDNETILALEYGHNLRDGKDKYRTPFMDMYRAFEAKEGRGKTGRELQEQRIGHWIFLYAVLQVLPLLISDAPGLSYTDGVEYFLSATPPERMPWITEAVTNIGQYQTAKGTLSFLPTHQIEFGINSIYSRSHCWQAANSWLSGAEEETFRAEENRENQLSPLSPPPGFSGELRGRERALSTGAMGPPPSRPGSGFSGGFLGVGDAERSGSRSRLSQRNSIALGLEQLPRYPVPEEFAVTGSTVTRTPPERDVTFDDILAGFDQGGGKKKKGKK